MVSTRLSVKNKFESPTQIGFSEHSAVNSVFPQITKEVARLLWKSEPQIDSNKYAKTIAIRALEPEYRQVFAGESLTVRELEVLQLIVNGSKNTTSPGSFT